MKKIMTKDKIQSKIQSWKQLKKTVNNWKSTNSKIIFTNGCFDILHFGHFHYLMEAKDLGDKLIVGLNSAASVSRLKGSHRPINDEQTRLFSLASLAFVDAVVVFEEDTPFNLIAMVIPDILVKGGDYKIEEIVGADIVLKNGGTVNTLPFVDGYSTTKIEEKIRNI